MCICFADHLYSGATNDLVAVRELTLEVLCHYDLSNYPFDTQRCPLSLFLAKYTSDLFVVRISNYTFSGNRRHHEYQLRHIWATNVTSGSYAGERLILVLRNQYVYYISAAYVPSGMLLVISYLTYFFSINDFQTRITVALTSLLVLATLFSELVGGLPKTSYLKLIDVWFLGCIAADFGMVVCLVLINKQTQEDPTMEDPISKNPKSENGPQGVSIRQVIPREAFGRYKEPGLPRGPGEALAPKWTHRPGGLRHANPCFPKSRLNTFMKVAIPMAISILIIAYSIAVMVILET